MITTHGTLVLYAIDFALLQHDAHIYFIFSLISNDVDIFLTTIVPEDKEQFEKMNWEVLLHFAFTWSTIFSIVETESKCSR